MPPDAANEPAYAVDPRNEPAPTGLPRLQVIHLMLWMAATAVAFLPYQMQRQAQDRMSPGAAELSQTVSATAIGVITGLSTGSDLLVVAALWYWRRKGRGYRLQPGHWFAFEGVGQWIMAAGLWLIILNSEGPRYGSFAWRIIPHLLIGLGFFACYIWLAWRSKEPSRWRWTFAATALSPVAAWLLTVVAAFTGSLRGSIGAFMISSAATTAVVGLLLLAAMVGDLRVKTDRHWSHWLVAGMRLAVLVATAAMYAYFGLYPQAITGK